jgi:hypothetical protein
MVKIRIYKKIILFISKYNYLYRFLLVYIEFISFLLFSIGNILFILKLRAGKNYMDSEKQAQLAGELWFWVTDFWIWIQRPNWSQYYIFRYLVCEKYPTVALLKPPFFIDDDALLDIDVLIPPMNEIIRKGWLSIEWTYEWEKSGILDKNYKQSEHTKIKNACQFLIKIRWNQLLNEIIQFKYAPPKRKGKVAGYKYKTSKIRWDKLVKNQSSIKNI